LVSVALSVVDEPRLTLPKDKFEGVSEPLGVTPVPDKGVVNVAGPVGTVKVPFCVPPVLGVKFTVKLQLAAAARDAGQLLPAKLK
jgi:hypothetical protein